MHKPLDLIDRFIARYRREVDFHETVAAIAAQDLRTALKANGIRAIVTSRAKDVEGLRDKLRRRATDKKYKNEDDI